MPKDHDSIGDYFNDFKSNGTQVTRLMRAILVNWMGEVAEHFYLKRLTLHLAVGYLDKYLCYSEIRVNRQNFQLLGISCLYLASKFEVSKKKRNEFYIMVFFCNDFFGLVFIF